MIDDKRDLLEGNIYKSLIRFSIPFLIANFIQALYGTVDLLVIGIFTDTPGLSSVAVGTQVMQVINGVTVGFTMGGTILIGQYYGSKKKEEIPKTIGNILSLGSLIFLFISIIMFMFTKQLLHIVKTPQLAMVDAQDYVKIASSGIIFIFVYNAISAILRGMGDSKTPIYLIGIACICNIVLDLLFVGAFQMRAYGAALATILSQGLSALLGIIYIHKTGFLNKFGLMNLGYKDFKIEKERSKKFVKLSLPLALQEVLLWVSFLIIAIIANSMGVVESAAVGIVAKFEVFSMLPPMAFSYSLAAFTAQNMGGNKSKRAKKALKISVATSLVCSLLFFAWGQINPGSIIKIFKADNDVVIAGGKYLKTFSIDFMLVAIKFNLNGFLNGCGSTAFTMINGISSSLLIRVPIAFLLAIFLSKGLLGLGLAAPIASITSISLSLIYIYKGNWERKII